MITAHLTFNGSAEEAFKFYQKAIGGEIKSLQHFGDTPHKEHLPAEDHRKVMHASLETPIGTIMGSDYIESMGYPFQPGNNFSLTIQAKSEQQAEELFKKLSQGGTITMPIQKVFWGAYFGMFTDRFGIQWMVNHQPT